MAMSVVYATVNGRLAQENRGGTVTRYVADTLGGVIQAYIYNPNGQVSAHLDAAGNVTTFEYDPAGRETTIQYMSGVTSFSVYDAAGQLTGKRDRKSGTLIQRFTFSYDPNGNRDGILDLIGSFTTYTYDAKDRLFRDETTGTNAHDYTYTYDAVDGRLTSSETGVVIAYSYDPAQRLVTSTDGASYSYGPNGNLEVVSGVGNQVTMSYDKENRLIRHEDDTSIATYTYNGDGLKAVEIVDGVTTTLIWDGSDYLGEVS